MTTVHNAPSLAAGAKVLPIPEFMPEKFKALAVQVRSYENAKEGTSGEYRSAKLQFAEKNITVPMGPVVSMYGMAVHPQFGTSFGINLRRSVPYEAKLLECFEKLHQHLKPHVMNMRLRGVSSTFYDESMSFLSYPIDKTTNMPILTGDAILYVQVTDKKFPTKISIGKYELSVADARRLENTTFTAYVQWDIHYLYVGAKTKFMTGCREILITSVTPLKSRSAFDEVVSVSDETSDQMLALLHANDAKTREDKESRKRTAGDAGLDGVPATAPAADNKPPATEQEKIAPGDTGTMSLEAMLNM